MRAIGWDDGWMLVSIVSDSLSEHLDLFVAFC